MKLKTTLQHPDVFFMQETQSNFQVFLKPVGSSCNLNCKYCYYLKNNCPEEKSAMDKEILEQYIIQQIDATQGNTINFSWHGGEPTLAGLNYFKKIVALQKKHKPSGATIINGIQTNGTLLNDDWCDFFSKENFIVGISIDGPEKLNDSYRINRKGSSVFHQIINGYKLLQKYNVPNEILCVVNDKNVKYPLKVYNFFKSLGAQYLTFIPLVIPGSNSTRTAALGTVPSKEFGIFLSRIFDEWVNKDIGKIKIQIFEEAARVAFKQDHTLCIFKKTCGRVPVIEKNGDFYSCDHFVDSNHLIGNITKDSISDLLEKQKQKDFGDAKLKKLPEYCLRCEVLDMCNGGCPKNRIIQSPDGEPGLNYLCDGYKYFFNHCQPFVEAVAMAWNQQ